MILPAWIHFFEVPAAAAAKSLQLSPTLCDPINSSPPGSPVPGILQARTLEWVAISFSIAWKWKVKVKSFSRDQLVATPWTVAHQAPPSMGFSRQEYWSGLPLPFPFEVPKTVKFRKAAAKSWWEEKTAVIHLQLENVPVMWDEWVLEISVQHSAHNQKLLLVFFSH